ncbi:hypothetical protein NDU88_002630 [Pleurodeles waltl]|uniref:Uncharacterized protein n=1 Tax=Pleurodeles waltl TaxID=8319 RepID=A0AAV7QD85_PLEWA|nr:hypothetical protein NDU88_002630 [Pleurodeles waltl]
MQLGPAGPERTQGAWERLAAAPESRAVARGSSGRGLQQCTAVPYAEAILQKVRNLQQIQFRGYSLQLYQDLSVLTLQRRREFKPITDHLRAASTSYTWGHPFRLVFCWDNQMRQVKTLQEARRVLGLEETEQRTGCPWGGGPC